MTVTARAFDGLERALFGVPVGALGFLVLGEGLLAVRRVKLAHHFIIESRALGVDLGRF